MQHWNIIIPSSISPSVGLVADEHMHSTNGDGVGAQPRCCGNTNRHAEKVATYAHNNKR